MKIAAAAATPRLSSLPGNCKSPQPTTTLGVSCQRCNETAAGMVLKQDSSHYKTCEFEYWTWRVTG
eukprot:m.228914 g.228914  ORF g.228914 m.228914 type:complete len:66 (-) comp15197_c0_seq3:900-1097(-)